VGARRGHHLMGVLRATHTVLPGMIEERAAGGS
jgi:hypothetical protein